MSASKRLATIVAVSYSLLYLYLLGDIDIGATDWRWRIVPPENFDIFAQRNLLHFEAMAMLELGWITLLLSPLNIAIAISLGVLLALNVHGVMAMRAQSCQLSASASGLSATPAILTGGACCAPSLLLTLGIPGLGVIASYIGWLLPLSALLLLINRIWQRTHGAPGWQQD